GGSGRDGHCGIGACGWQRHLSSQRSPVEVAAHGAKRHQRRRGGEGLGEGFGVEWVGDPRVRTSSMETFGSLLARHAGLSFEKQCALADFLGSHNWSLDTERALISFGPGKGFPIQILGTESESSYTWLWAWANEASGLSEDVVRDSIRLQRLGEETGIQELAQPEVGLGPVSGHHLALIASGVCDAAGYYRGAYDGGAVYVLLYDPKKVIVRDESIVRMTRVFLDLICQIELEHRPA